MTDLREGYTTGTCAAAAAKAAATVLAGGEAPDAVDVDLPDGTTARLPLLYAKRTDGGAEAAVRKDAGDDPDVTDGVSVVVSVAWAEAMAFEAGEGVGTVTLPGLQVPPGEPAINPAPRAMLRRAVAQATDRPVRVTISIPGGRELAAKTFNPRLGIEGGLSILGTSGRVRPYSCAALREALKCSLDVAAADGVVAPVLVPGHVGRRAAERHFPLSPRQALEIGNEWGFVLDCTAEYAFGHVLVLGHPGKIAKLAHGEWDTHSSRSSSATPIVARLGAALLGRPMPEMPTTEGIFAALPEPERSRLADALAREVRRKVAERIHAEPAVVLVNMRGDWLGSDGNLETWR
ncbi:cobalamin biosynthesis protein CbiD [bacterium]|nr:cobalamin biosynthesis protein CbiD [bacterium]